MLKRRRWLWALLIGFATVAFNPAWARGMSGQGGQPPATAGDDKKKADDGLSKDRGSTKMAPRVGAVAPQQHAETASAKGSAKSGSKTTKPTAKAKAKTNKSDSKKTEPAASK